MKVYVMNQDPQVYEHDLDADQVEKYSKKVLAYFRKRLKRIIPDCSIIFVDEKEIRKLNKRYRDIDKPTDVLSFNSEEDGYLGDILIAKSVVASYARKFSVPFEEELKRDIIHGIMHLLGYDHTSHLYTDTHEEMFAIQEDILRTL